MKLKKESRKERISAGLSSTGVGIILIASCAEGFAKIDSVPANVFRFIGSTLGLIAVLMAWKKQ